MLPTPSTRPEPDPGRQAASDRRRQLVEAGLCFGCRNPAEPGRRRCRRCLDKHAAVSRANNERLRREVMQAYGGLVCACCGEARLVLLTLDHINQDAGRLRRAGSCEAGIRFYRRLKRQGFPPGYRVLCRNCNFAVYRAADKRCPHRQGCFAHDGDPAPITT